MDKLKTRVLFVALIILALVSVSTVAAADVDDVVSAEQEDIDLSEETVSDVESAQVESAQETDILTEDEPAQNPDGSSYITVKFSYITEDGPVEVVNQSLSKKVAANRNLTISYSNLLNNKPPANRFQYNGLNYNFTTYWENSVTGEIFKQARGCDQVFLATGYNYTVVLTAQYETYDDTFVNISYIVKDSSGDDVNITETYNIPYPGSFYEVFVSKNNFTNLNKTYKGYTLDGYEYYLDHWEDGDGNVVDSTKSYNHGYTGENYTVTYKAIYKAKGNPSNIAVKVVGLKDVNGNDVNSELTNKIDPGVTWIIRYAMFEDDIDRYKTYDANGVHYTFKHLLDPEGVPITDPESYERTLKPNGTDYDVVYTAVYNEEVIGNFTLIYNDEFGHGSGSWNSTNNYGVDFTHTFKEPADYPNGAKFLYWEMEDTLEKFNPDDEFSVVYADFAGKTVVVYVNAVYDIETSVELEEITDYVEEVIDITANIKSEVFIVDDPNGGTATLTIVYGDGNTYTQTVDVENGKAVFKDVKLENPGDFTYKVEYSRYSYNKHEEGINDYLPSSAESKLHILALNTTVSNASETGKPGDKVTVEFTVTDQNNNPVQNGTLTVTVDGTTYTDEVKDGKVTFDIILPNPGNYTYDVNYEGNDYYNPSVGQLNLTVQKVDVIVTLPEVINYTGAVVDIVVEVVDEFGELVNEGTITLTIDWGTKLSDKLMATAQTLTEEVHDAKATFSGITLGEPGTYPSKAEYSGTDYYNEAENESDVVVMPLDTTTESQDVSGQPGDKMDITADIVDQNGNPVKNGTAVLKVNGKEYTAEVKDGKAKFKDVELPDESTEATIDYLGNEYYNPSSTTIQITVTQPEEPEEPVDEPEEEPSTPAAEKTVPVTPAAGNPIALVVVALLSLVSTVSFGRKK
ncbi:MAG: Ig-like domain repeat protein [Methanobrevibacter olleyae]|uniref:Ig-like domain repeat protein n=1 Tax=Methanobrevibacter olleyae TaxID=294671 RepID=A0A8T3VVS7_METOL|nr:Ig-like domain repeat protein [Methanobrevibacter olleyae]